LLSAEWTAQVRHHQQVETAIEVVDTCAALGVTPTLLKGISISEQYYPEPHLRPMGDVDVLVPQTAREAVETKLIGLGYRPMAGFRFDAESNHGVPLQHPTKQVWVEIHTHLFPRGASVRRTGVFARDDLAGQIVASEFFGRPVQRLTAELQLVYLAGAWVRDLSDEFDVSRAVALFDAIYLLRSSGPRIDWDGMFRWVDNEAAMASTYLLAAYLARHGLNVAPEPILSRLRSAQRTFRAWDLRLVHALIDRYVLEGRIFPPLFHSSRLVHPLLTPRAALTKLLLVLWNVAFPASAHGRYTLRYQLERVPRLMRRLLAALLMLGAAAAGPDSYSQSILFL
jgi:hypothetical protein